MAVLFSADYDMGGSGSGQYLNVNFTGPNLRASHTIMCRVKHQDSGTGYNALQLYYLAQSDVSGSGVARVSGSTSTAMTWLRQGGFFSYTQDAAARSTCFGNTSTWYHIALVYNATTGQIRSYIDGTFIAQQASSTTRPISSTANGFGIAGSNKIADAAFFDRELSDSEVADMADYRVPQVTSGLQVFWRLDSDANDSSGNGRNGSVAGSGTAPTYSTADNPPQPETPTVDIAGGATTGSTLAGALTVAKAFVGAATSASTLAGDLRLTKQIAAAATSASTLSGDLTLTKQLTAAASTASTLAAWIRPRWGRRIDNSPGLTRASFGLSLAGGFTMMTWIRHINVGTGLARFYISSTAAIELSVVNSNIFLRLNDGSADVISHNVADDGNWHHVCISFDGTTARAYIDATQVATATPTLSGTVNSLQIDNAAGSGVGEFAHAKVWSSALSAAEIAQEKDFYAPAHANPSLMAWYQLSWQNVTLDSSGNGRTLTAGTGSVEAQTEAPGLPLTDLAGGATSASSLAGTLSVAKPLVGAASSASTLAGTLSQAQPLVGAPATASALAGTLSVAKPIAGAAASSSALAGTLSLDQPLVAGASTSSSLTGSLDVSVPLAAGASTASTLSGTLGLHIPLEGALSTGSSLGGALGIEGAFGGNALTTSTLAGTLSVDKPITGAAASSSSLAGTLSQLQPLGAAANTASTLAGSITVIKQAEGAAATSSTLAGTLGVAVAAAGAAATSSSLSGTLSLTQQLGGSAQTASTLTGTLTVQNVLSGAASSSSHLAGTLSVDVIWYLSAVARTGSYLTGALTVTVPASARGNVVTDGKADAYYSPATILGPGRPRRWPPRY